MRNQEKGTSSMPGTPSLTTRWGHLPARIKRRTSIPEKPNYSINLWSIMKNCIGKELSKIPMPVSESCVCMKLCLIIVSVMQRY
jgi:hypothetical protein